MIFANNDKIFNGLLKNTNVFTKQILLYSYIIIILVKIPNILFFNSYVHKKKCINSCINVYNIFTINTYLCTLIY